MIGAFQAWRRGKFKPQQRSRSKLVIWRPRRGKSAIDRDRKIDLLAGFMLLLSSLLCMSGQASGQNEL